MLASLRIALPLGVLALSSCARKPAAPQVPPPTARVGPASPGAQPGKSDHACVAGLDEPAARTSLRTAQGQLVLGVLSGLKDPGDANVAHLKVLAGELKRRGAEALVATGDLGDTQDAQQLLLGALAQTGLPLFALAGNREVRSDLDAAEAELRRRGAAVVDLGHTRVVDLGDALVVGLPGTFDRRQLRADGACVYVQRDLEMLGAALDRLPAGHPPVILAGAVPPRGQDGRALDWSEGQNLGDPALAPLLQPGRAAIGIFGQVWEAGGRAIDGAGRPVAPGEPVEQLYLNPGAADRTPWPMADGTTVAGQAALLTVRGRRVSYEVLRAGSAG